MEREEVKHTAGSWGVEDPMDHCLTVVANPECPVHEWKWVAVLDWPDEDDHLVPTSEVKANARLISAAPDFHDAASRLLEAWDARTTGAQQIVTGKSDRELQAQAQQALDDLRKALAKASGQ